MISSDNTNSSANLCPLQVVKNILLKITGTKDVTPPRFKASKFNANACSCCLVFIWYGKDFFVLLLTVHNTYYHVAITSKVAFKNSHFPSRNCSVTGYCFHIVVIIKVQTMPMKLIQKHRFWDLLKSEIT